MTKLIVAFRKLRTRLKTLTIFHW